MKAANLTLSPGVTVEWKGRLVGVRNANVAMGKLGLSPEEAQEFLKLVHEKEPRLVVDYGMPSIFSSAVAFVKSWMANTGESVDGEEIERRKAICIGCEFRAHMELGCTGCSAAARMLMHAPKIEGLRGDSCLKCGCYLAVKVTQVDEVILADTRKITYPDHCWVKSIKDAASSQKA
jgi:hypothetical protein